MTLRGSDDCSGPALVLRGEVARLMADIDRLRLALAGLRCEAYRHHQMAIGDLANDALRIDSREE